MDFAKLDVTASADRGAVMKVRHPVKNDDGVCPILEGVTVTLLGYDSTKRKKLTDELQKAAIEKAKESKKETFDTRSFTMDIRCACVIGWSGFEEIVGDELKAIEFTPGNVRRILERHEWLCDQIDVFISDRRNFFLTQSKD